MANPFRGWRRRIERAHGPVIDLTPPDGGGPHVPHLPPLPHPSGRGLGTLLLLFALVLGVWTSFYQVAADEVGIVLRFGRYTGREVQPGLRTKLPYGIDRVIKVPVQRQLKQEFGFRTAQAAVRSTYQEGSFGDESLMLTGDLNAAEVEWIVQYRIRDPYRYLFRVRNVTDTFRDLSEASMRAVVGDRTVNEILTVGRQDVANQAAKLLQERCDQYEMGLVVEQVVLQDVTPPDPVKPSFNEVNQAQQEREKLINQARAEYNQVVPRAKGEAEKTIAEAEGYAVDRVNRARGEAARFVALHEEYRKAPALLRRRVYLETLGEVLPKVERKVIIDESAKGVLPLLNLMEGKTP
jgi:membrane protease subunit HflK